MRTRCSKWLMVMLAIGISVLPALSGCGQKVYQESPENAVHIVNPESDVASAGGSDAHSEPSIELPGETSTKGKTGEASAPDVRAVYEEFLADPEAAAAKYRESGVVVTGVVLRTGADIHGTPSVELSDKVGGARYATMVVQSFEQLDDFAVGETVTMQGNFHIFSNSEWGIVAKQAQRVVGNFTLG